MEIKTKSKDSALDIGQQNKSKQPCKAKETTKTRKRALFTSQNHRQSNKCIPAHQLTIPSE